MPNPRQHATYLDLPLDQYLYGATHIEITCTCPRAVGTCGHRKRMLTRELVALCPGAVTVQDFRDRLRCQGCKTKGWARIEGLGR